MKLRYIFGLLLGAAAFSSCDLMNNIDSIQPQYQLDEENYITTPKSAEQALNGIYQGWRAWGISPVRVHVSVLSGGISATQGVSGIEGFSTNEVEVDNIATIKDLIRRDFGVSILPRRLLIPYLDAHELCEITLKDQPLNREWYLIHHSRKALTAPMQEFIRFLQQTTW